MATRLLALQPLGRKVPGTNPSSRHFSLIWILNPTMHFQWSRGSKLPLVMCVYSCVPVPTTSGIHSLDTGRHINRRIDMVSTSVYCGGSRWLSYSSRASGEIKRNRQYLVTDKAFWCVPVQIRLNRIDSWGLGGWLQHWWKHPGCNRAVLRLLMKTHVRSVSKIQDLATSIL